MYYLWSPILKPNRHEKRCTSDKRWNRRWKRKLEKKVEEDVGGEEHDIGEPLEEKSTTLEN